MNIRYLVQPAQQVGRILEALLSDEPRPAEVILVSAFASRQTLLRLRPAILRLRDAGTRVRLVLGIDLGGTSKEALQEAHSWAVDTRLVKHRQAGHTFHPKLYLVERLGQANLLIGSSNITDGGFFTNYEGGVLFTYDLPGDAANYAEARASLERFLAPDGPTAQILSEELLARLLVRGDVPTNEEQRRARTGEGRRSPGAGSPFGVEAVATPPPMPADVLDGLLDEVRSVRRRRLRTEGRTQAVVRTAVAQIEPMSLFMTLPKMRGSIPGEARIPLEARDLTPGFWGWPGKYGHEKGPRGGEREYWSWKPKWRLWDSDNPDEVFVDEVRMYEYTNSSDFRFYARRLLNLGADEGDVVRVTRVVELDVEFECALARRNSRAYDDWLRYCTRRVRNSDRRYGYA